MAFDSECLMIETKHKNGFIFQGQAIVHAHKCSSIQKSMQHNSFSSFFLHELALNCKALIAKIFQLLSCLAKISLIGKRTATRQ